MTCVSCSNSIEKAIKTEFTKKGLESVSIVLLTHTMTVTMKGENSNTFADQITEEVELIGFGCELLDIKQLGGDVYDNVEGGPIDEYKTCNLLLDGMTCASCVNTIISHLEGVDGIKTAAVVLLTHKAKVTYNPKKIGIREIIEEVEMIGFGAKFQAKENKGDIRRVV